MPPGPVSIASQIRRLAAESPAGFVAYRHVALDESEPGFDWAELDRRSGQVAGALAARGLGHGLVPDLPDVVSPQLNGTCSSGSTGTVTHPQTILVPTAMYHTNGFAALRNLIAGAQGAAAIPPALVRRWAAFIEAERTSAPCPG